MFCTFVSNYPALLSKITGMAHLTHITLPIFGKAEQQPTIPNSIYQQRMAKLTALLQKHQLDMALVYADREHFANLQYLTGFDPRFEEALFLIDQAGQKLLLVGNECMGYLPDPALGIKVEMFQELSLLGQPRSKSRPLRHIFSEFGITTGKRISCIGWKYFAHNMGQDLIEGGTQAIEIPAYLVDLLRNLSGNPANVVNATALLMNPIDGLRIFNEAEQIALCEYASTRTSEAILALLKALQFGASESALERHLAGDGLPLSCHRMISFGKKAQRGLSSPSQNQAKLGDPFSTAFGLTGALTCRAGVIAASADELPEHTRHFYPALAHNYFDVVTTWYEHIRVGASGGQVFAAVEQKRDTTLYDFAVNPGHYLHLDEWVHSPFFADSDIILQSGVLLQMDIIPISRGPFCYINAEDGVLLADAALREQLCTQYPAMWTRMQARRRFMREALGIQLHESVLPLSNLPAWLPPYAFNLSHVMRK